MFENIVSGLFRHPDFARELGAATVTSGLSFGAWVGVFSATKCTLRVARGKKDIMNTFGGGFMAGVVTTMKTRSPTTMLASGIGSGILLAAFDSFSSIGL